MNADKTLSMIDSLRKATLKQKDSDIKTKYQVLTMFKDIEKLVKYQSPMPPINISEDRHKFECPRCGTKFETEDVVDDFNGCYICLQRWKEVKEDE